MKSAFTLAVCLATNTFWSAQVQHIDPPASPIEVLYDQHAIPHIFSFGLPAQTADDNAFYALGYTQMRDFPLQTLDNIFFSCGRYAEAWGEPTQSPQSPAEPNQAQDRFIRHWELPERAQGRYDALTLSDPDGVLPAISSYVAGLAAGQAWWLSHPSSLEAMLGTAGCTDCEIFVDPVPLPLITWNNLGQARAAVEHLFGLTVTVQDVLASGIALSAGLYGVAPPDGGTNAWIARTAQGDVLSMNDAHLDFNTGRFNLYFVQVDGAGYDVTGWTVPGFPCIVVGFNRNVSWITSVGGSFQIPNANQTSTLSSVHAGNTPVVGNVWGADLEPTTTNPDLRFSFGSGEEVLESDLKPITVWNGPGASVPFTTTLETMWYAPAEVGAVTARYPLVVGYDSPMAPPAGGSPIRFQQRAPVSGTAAWEFMIAMGRTASAASVPAILARTRYGFGGALNLLVADRYGRMEYAMMARVPEQGSGAQALAPWEDSNSYELDGHEPDQRWARIHPQSELPNRSSVTGEEVWISNNGTADLVVPGISYASYILEDEPIASWRQVRAEQLLDTTSTPMDLQRSETSAMDVQDVWVASMWNLFQEAHRQRLLGDSNVDGFVAFVEANKNEGGSEPFVANADSRVTPYTTLMRAAYEKDILAREDCGPNQPVGCLTEPQKRLGFDPLFVRPDANTFGTSGDWVPNLDAMESALVSVAALWANTAANPTAPLQGGIENVGIVGLLDLFVTSPLAVNSSPWAGLRALAPLDLRWGMVNTLSLTPHAAPFLPASAGCGFFQNSYASNYYPPVVPFSSPFFTAQRPAVWPIGGVWDSSLYTVNSMPYDESLYPCSGANNVYFRKLSHGSVTPISVEFPAGGGEPRAKFASSLGSTSHITAIPEFGIGAEDRWRPSQAFADRQWQSLETNYLLLRQPANHIHQLNLAGL